MLVDDQKEVTAFLSDAASYGLEGRVEVLETHISRVFLVGERAYKLKRAVKLPYLDYSTVSLRRLNCEKEVELNSLSTPELYLGVRTIQRDAEGNLSFGADGMLVDAIVEMRRFPQEHLLDKIAEEGTLSISMLDDLTRMIVEFHSAAAIVSAESGAENMRSVIDINAAGFRTSQVFTPVEQANISKSLRERLAKHAAILDRRSRDGKIRHCHGDLHLRNLCLVNGTPRLFDRIEFNDRIATVDVLYDLAFLLMDLWHRGFKDHANRVANRYADLSGEDNGFVLLPFFMAIRASVRAHVIATQVQEAAGDAQLEALARSYYQLAVTLLQQAPPILVAIGGFSGSGKTTIADALAGRIGPPPGARILESDRIRKGLLGAPAFTHLGDDAYAPPVTRMVYAKIADRAETILASGAAVVADAVYSEPTRRLQIDAVARKLHVEFLGLWLDVPIDVLRARISARLPGQSDATTQVLEAQVAKGAGHMDWLQFDGSQTAEIIIEDIIKKLKLRRFRELGDDGLQI